MSAVTANRTAFAAEPLGGFEDPALAPLWEKFRTGERLDRADGLALHRSTDLSGLGWMANQAREARHGAKTFYNVNRHINYTNICVSNCKFCSFARRPHEKDGQWEYTLDEIYQKALTDMPPGGDELHIVGGLHPRLPFEYYENMLRGLKRLMPHVHLKAFTAVEIGFFAKKFGMTVEETLRRLIAAGLGSMPGGGAELLTPGSRELIANSKIDGAEWIDIHRTAHRLGLKTNTTMLFGHIETDEERIDHLLMLRELQNETGGFQVFIPLAFHPAYSQMQELPAPTGADALKLIAVARLVLDNFDHVKAYWIMLGVKTAQIAQLYGADDFDGTVVEETIYHMAGAETPQALGVKDIRRLIEEMGRIPVRRDTLYNEIENVS